MSKQSSIALFFLLFPVFIIKSNYHLNYSQESKPSNGIFIHAGGFSLQCGPVNVALDLVQGIYSYLVGIREKKQKEKDYINTYNKWNSKDFCTYFVKHFDVKSNNFSPDQQEEMLKQYHLYQFSSFCDFVKDFPLARALITEFKYRLNSDTTFKKEIQQACGLDTSQFETAVTDLVARWERLDNFRRDFLQKQAKERAEREQKWLEEQKHCQSVCKNIRQHMEGLKTLAFEYGNILNEFEPNNSEVYERISQRQEKIKESTKDIISFTEQEYDFSDNTKKMLNTFECLLPWYTRCYGTPFSHLLHTECIQIVEKAVQLQDNKKNSTEFSGVIIQWTNLACGLNQKGLQRMAVRILDFCWNFLDCTIVMIDGVTEGIQNTTEFLHNPVSNILKFGEVVYRCAQSLVEIIEEHIDMNSKIEGNWSTTMVMNVLFDYFNNQFRSINQQEFIKTSVSGITEGTLLLMLFQNISDFFSHLSSKFSRLDEIEKNENFELREKIVLQVADIIFEKYSS